MEKEKILLTKSQKETLVKNTKKEISDIKGDINEALVKMNDLKEQLKSQEDLLSQLLEPNQIAEQQVRIRNYKWQEDIESMLSGEINQLSVDVMVEMFIVDNPDVSENLDYKTIKARIRSTCSRMTKEGKLNESEENNVKTFELTN